MTLIPIPELAESSIFGHGANFITEAAVNATPIEAVPTDVSVLQAPQADTSYYKVIASSADYTDTMKASATISGSGLSWSVSASASYMRQHAGSDSSVTFTWVRRLRTQDRLIAVGNVTISADAMTKLQSDPDGFLDQYGTHCMTGIAYGASFSGYVRVDTNSVSDKESIAASLSASINGLVTHGSISATFSSDLQSSSTNSTTEMGYTSMGMPTLQVTGGLKVTDIESGVVNMTPLTDDGHTGVTGHALAVVCVTWDQVGDIQSQCSPAVLDKLRLTDIQAMLDRISTEYAKLSYAIQTASRLTSSSRVVPALVPLLQQLATVAQDKLSKISQFKLADIRWLAQDPNRFAWYEISALILPQIESVGRGYCTIEVYNGLDWAFGSPNTTQNIVVRPADNAAEVHLGQWVHVRPEGSDPPQTMDLYYRVYMDGSTPTITTRMVWHDPWGPGSGEYRGPPAQLLQNQNNTSVAQWTSWPNNCISVGLVGKSWSLPPDKQ